MEAGIGDGDEDRTDARARLLNVGAAIQEEAGRGHAGKCRW